MSDLSITISAEKPGDAQAIERLHERTFGPGRFVLSAYRLREHVDHLLELSFTAHIGTLLVGSVRQLPICVGDTKALILGPLTVEPPFRKHGIGRMLMERSISDAKAQGHRLILLVGDAAYYARVGFKPVPSVKVVSNSATYERMRFDMDINAGRILEGRAGIDDVADELLALVLATAAGAPTESEDLGHQEFVLTYKSSEPTGPACLPMAR